MKLKVFLCIVLCLTLLSGCAEGSDGETVTDEITSSVETLPESEEDTGNNYVVEPLPESEDISIWYQGEKYICFRLAVDTEVIEKGDNYEFVGKISACDSEDSITSEVIPLGTDVYTTYDSSVLRVILDGLTYYFHVENAVDDIAKKPYLQFEGKYYESDISSTGGEAWSFQLDDNWKSVGFVNSIVYSEDPEYDLETNLPELLGMWVYYNENENRLAVHVKDDNDAYSDVDWELYIRSDK